MVDFQVGVYHRLIKDKQIHQQHQRAFSILLLGAFFKGFGLAL